MTTRDWIVGAVGALVPAGYRIEHGNFAVTDFWSLFIPAVWLFCFIALYNTFIAARSLYREDFHAFSNYKSPIHIIGDIPVRKRPARWHGVVTAGLLGVVFLSLAVVATMSEPSAEISVSPSTFVLNDGKFSEHTRVAVTNTSTTQHAYAVFLKIWTETNEMSPADFDVEVIDYNHNAPIMTISPPKALQPVRVSGDVFIFGWIDASKHPGKLIRLYELAPGETRYIEIAGTKTIKSNATARVIKFDTSPPKIVTADNKTFWQFAPPENGQMEGWRFRTVGPDR